MENLNLNLNQQAAVNLANLQQLNLKDDVFINNIVHMHLINHKEETKSNRIPLSPVNSAVYY